jgi:hypothetical protein
LQREKDRCPKCNYILGDLEIWGCIDCNRMFHRQCAEEGKKDCEDKQEVMDWVCLDCKFCLICNYKHMEMERCEKCRSFFHKECIGSYLEKKEEKTEEGFIKKEDPIKKSEELNLLKKEDAMKEEGVPVKREDSKGRRDEGSVCPKCSICSCCGKQKELVSGVDDKQICESCNQIQLLKEFCKVCGKPRIRTSKVENKKHAKHWIFCNGCSGWIHRLCDSLLAEEKMFGMLQSSSNLEYFCPVCRVDRKKRELADFVEILAE